MKRKSSIVLAIVLACCSVLFACAFLIGCEKKSPNDSSLIDSSYPSGDSSSTGSSGDSSSTNPEPDPEPDPDPDRDLLKLHPISSAYAAADGDILTVCGVVTGFVGNSFYMSNGDYGVYVYSSTDNGCAKGDLVLVSAEKATFKGLVELKNVSLCEVKGTADVAATSLTSLSEIEDYLSMPINIANLSLAGTGTIKTPKSGSDYSIKVTDGTTEATLFVSKYIQGKATELYDVLCENEYFSLEGAVVSCYNDYQVAFVETTEIVTEVYEVTGIAPDKAEYTVPTGTTLDEVANYLTIVATLENNGTRILDRDEFTLTCPNYKADVDGCYTVTVGYGELNTSVNVIVKNLPNYTRLAYGDKTPLKNAAEKTGVTKGLPSTGSPKVLVIPVAFTDYPADKNMRSDLQTAFFGTSEQTGWESLTSYYQKASYGKLNIGGTVTEVYNTGKKSTYFNNEYKKGNSSDYEILQGALEYFDDAYDYSQYDYDNDGMIDGVYLVYTAPVDYESEDSLWWAFTYEYLTETEEYYDGKQADFYLFMGYGFLFDEPASGATLTYNCETVIHETGHMLGLDDYYDYDDTKGPDGGIGGGDMMDYNVGDHNAFSKLLLGWVDPYVVTGNCNLTLSSFGASGDCIMVCKNKADPFSEYFIIDYYTPDGLNEMEAGNSGLFSVSGIRVYHIDASIQTNSSKIDGIWGIYKNNNSDTTNKLIALVEADGKGDITKGNGSGNSDLYAAGKTISGLKWNDGTSAKFSATITASGNDMKLAFVFN